MARYDVTPELASVIKSTRISHNVTAKAVAEQVGKSQAYISKLEKGELKSIDQDLLTDIFIFILGSEEAFQEYLNQSLADLISSLTLRHDKNEIKKQSWFDNFDTVLRKIPIPDSLVDEINKMMIESNITVDDLVERINGNEGIRPPVDNIDFYPENTWIYIVKNGEIKHIFIKMRLTKEQVENILTYRVKSTNYVSMQAIVYYILIIQLHFKQKDIPDNSYISLSHKTVDLLNKHQFFSLAEKDYLESQAKNEQEHNALISEFDKENSKTINEIIKVFKVFSDVDMLRTTDYLNHFKENLKWDSGFMMEIINLQFNSLIDTDINQRKNLLKEIDNLIKVYASTPSESNNAKFYD